MAKRSQIAIVITALLLILSYILLQFPCQSSNFPYPSVCPSHAVYLIFNFPAVIVGILILQLIQRPAQYLNYVYYISPIINAIWWFFLISLLIKWKSKR